MLQRGKTGRLDAAIRGGGKRLAIGLVAGSLLVVGLGTTGTAKVSPDADPVVIRDLNATMVATVVVDAGKANAEAFMWFGFVQAAVYNAVEGVTRDYELYRWKKDGPQEASPEAAAAAAAHDVLLEYFPGSQARLDAQLASSLAGVTDGSAEQQGVEYGQAAAAHLIKQRLNDGRNAPITFDKAPAPGVWRPTPTAFVPMFDPWLSQIKPMMMTSSTQFRPGPPPALTSALYTADFKEFKKLGAKDELNPNGAADRDGTVHDRRRDRGVPGRPSRSDRPARDGHQRYCTSVRRGGHEHRRRDDRRVGLEVPLRVLATDHRHPARRYGREPGHGGAGEVGPFVPTGTPPYPDYVSGFNGVTGALTGSLFGHPRR